MLHNGLREARINAVRVAPTVPSLPTVSYRVLRLLGRDLRAFLRNYPLWSAYPKADVYHVTSQPLAALLVLRRPKGKVVVTVHDIFPYMLRNDPQLRSSYYIDPFYVRVAMAGLKRADHLIAISEYTKQCVVEHLGIAPEKISVIYHGIDHQHFRPLPVPTGIRESYGLPEGRRYLIYVGREDPRKNLVTLVRALAQLRRDLPDVELIKVGRSHSDIERRRLVELATQLGIRTAIHFLEDVPEDDLPPLYNLADLCVMPSPYEGFGFPALEAMACGTPIVCANVGSLHELVGNAGVQVYPHDIDILAGNLLALLNSTDKQLMLRRTGQDRAANFTWTATILNTTGVYERLIHADSDGGANRL